MVLIDSKKGRKGGPPSPPSPQPPPAPPPTPTGRKVEAKPTITELSRQDPPSPAPPVAPPPSPARNASFVQLKELTASLGGVLDGPSDSRTSYFYCADDITIPGTPPALVYSPRTSSLKFKAEKRKRSMSDVDDDLLESIAFASSPSKRRKPSVEIDNTLMLPSLRHISSTEFFSRILDFNNLQDLDIFHEGVHCDFAKQIQPVRVCA